MNELDHILDVHRREAARGETAVTILAFVVIAIGYCTYRLIGWLA